MLPFTCHECYTNADNYLGANSEDNEHTDDLIYIDNKGKNIIIDESTEISIINVNDYNDATKDIPTHNKNNTTDFKNNLLASLYSQVEFLRQVIVEKDHQIKDCNMHINVLLAREVDNTIRVRSNVESTVSSDASSVREDPYISETVDNFFNNDNSNVFKQSSVLDDSIQTVLSSSEDDNSKQKDDEIFLDMYQQSLQLQIMEDEKKNEIDNKMKTQLLEIRAMKHDAYKSRKTDNDDTVTNTEYRIDRGLKPIPEANNMEFLRTDETEDINEVIAWPKGTCLIMGSSLLNGIKEELMGPRFRVRPFPGAIIADFYNYAIPFIKKKPSYIIIMAGSNDAVNKNKCSKSILEELLGLKSFLQSKFRCDVIISCPTYRFDDQRANVTLRNLRNNLVDLNVPVISNSNITEMHIGKKGLHLNERGSGRLAVNYLSYMRKH